MKLIQNVVNKKINNITIPELFKYCEQYHITITHSQAEQVVSVIQQKWIDIYNPKDRLKLLNNIALISNKETAQKVNQLLQKLI